MKLALVVILLCTGERASQFPRKRWGHSFLLVGAVLSLDGHVPPLLPESFARARRSRPA